MMNRGAQHVRVDVPEPGALADRAHQPVRGAPVEPLSVASAPARTLVAFPDSEIDRAGFDPIRPSM